MNLRTNHGVTFDVASDDEFPMYEEEEYDEASTEDDGEQSEEVSGHGDFEDTAEPIPKLSKQVQNRVHELQKLQMQKNALREQYLSELSQLQRKYEGELAPLLDEQRDIIKGSPPSPREIEDIQPIQGVPRFWLNALQQNAFIRTRISPRDEEALEYLVDIRYCANAHNPVSGFTMFFEFQENPYFEETILTKEYIKKPCVANAISEWYLADIVGSRITWKSDAVDLTRYAVEKKQRSKKTQEVRYTTVYEPCQSFFAFFDAPKFPDNIKSSAAERGGEKEGDDDHGVDSELEDFIDEDYEMACILKEKIITRALDYFIGDAVSSDEEEDDMEDLSDGDISSDGVFGLSTEASDVRRRQKQEECNQQ